VEVRCSRVCCDDLVRCDFFWPLRHPEQQSYVGGKIIINRYSKGEMLLKYLRLQQFSVVFSNRAKCAQQVAAK